MQSPVLLQQHLYRAGEITPFALQHLLGCFNAHEFVPQDAIRHGSLSLPRRLLRRFRSLRFAGVPFPRLKALLHGHVVAVIVEDVRHEEVRARRRRRPVAERQLLPAVDEVHLDDRARCVRVLGEDVLEQLLARGRRRHAPAHRAAHEPVEALLDVAQERRERDELHRAAAAREARVGRVVQRVVVPELTQAARRLRAAARRRAPDARVVPVRLDHVDDELTLRLERHVATEAPVASVAVELAHVVAQPRRVSEHHRAEGTPETRDVVLTASIHLCG